MMLTTPKGDGQDDNNYQIDHLK